MDSNMELDISARKYEIKRNYKKYKYFMYDGYYDSNHSYICKRGNEGCN